MKKYSGPLILFSLLVFSLCILPQFAMALGDPNDDPDIPVDGGVSLLVAAGVGYGVKKIREERKKKSAKIY